LTLRQASTREQEAAIPRFYFRLRCGSTVEEDDTGIEFASLEIAYLEAFRAARDIWHELLVERRDPRRYCFEICDPGGRLLLDLPFMEILESTVQGRSRVPLRGDATNRASRSRGLALSIAAQVEAARETISRSRSLLERSRGLNVV
jgi:hypothetical protein